MGHLPLGEDVRHGLVAVHPQRRQPVPRAPRPHREEALEGAEVHLRHIVFGQDEGPRWGALHGPPQAPAHGVPFSLRFVTGIESVRHLPLRFKSPGHQRLPFPDDAMGGRVAPFSGLGLRGGQRHQGVQLACGCPMPGRPDRHHVTRRGCGLQRGEGKDILRCVLQQRQGGPAPFRGEVTRPIQSRLPAGPKAVQQGHEFMADAVAEVAGIAVGRVFPPGDAGLNQGIGQGLARKTQEGPPHGEPPFRGPVVHAPPSVGPGAPDEVQQLGFALVVGVVTGQQDVALVEHLGEPSVPFLACRRFEPKAIRLRTLLQALHNVGQEPASECCGRVLHELAIRRGILPEPVVDMEDGHIRRDGTGGVQQGHGVRTAGHGHGDRMRRRQALLRKQRPQGIGQGGPFIGHPPTRSQIQGCPPFPGRPGRRARPSP